jgi:hypothetical protein
VRATVTGNLSNISWVEYEDSLIWHSKSDLPGIDKKTVKFRITASDTYTGLPLETPEFHLDNNLPPELQIGSIISDQSWLVEIPISLSDSENDSIEIKGEYKIGSGPWQQMQLGLTSLFSPVNYSDDLLWNSLNDLSYGEYKQVQVQLVPVDNDSGIVATSNSFDIYNYAGDYSGDIQINSEDLLPFALAWRQQELTKEIGPASGQPPLLIPQPDGVIDFEDLMVLVQQWNWSSDQQDNISKQTAGETISSNSAIQILTRINDNNNIEISRKELNYISHSECSMSSLRTHLVYMQQSEFDQWANKFADELILTIDTTAAILGYHIELDYDPQIFMFSEVNSSLFSKQDGIIFKSEIREKGKFILNAVVLETEKDLIEIQGELIKFKIDTKQEKQFPLTFTWKIYDENGKTLTEGASDIHLETHRSIPQTFYLYQNHPNPFNQRTIISYQLPVTSFVDLSIYNLLGQKVATPIDDKQDAGYYQVEWDGSDFASGIYFVQMRVKGDNGSTFVDQKKIILLK